MNMLKQLNDAVDYIERNLCGKPDIDKAASIACVTADSFGRFFSYMTGMTVNEYIRRRRLTLAAYELQQNDPRIIDIAVKYGYESADAFTKAFSKQHGVTPTQARKCTGSLSVYSPVSFYITIKGAQKMDFRIVEMEETEVYGVAKQFDGQGYKSREELRHIMWANSCDNVPGQICKGEWNQPSHHAYDGVWYGIWQDGEYMIAREKADTENHALKKRLIKPGTYAAFKTECGGLAWEELPKLRKLIFDSWLPGSQYVQKEDTVIEVFHLWTDREVRRKNRYYEIWIPVILK